MLRIKIYHFSIYEDGWDEKEWISLMVFLLLLGLNVFDNEFGEENEEK